MKRLVPIAFAVLMAGALSLAGIGSATAAQCIRAGGWGTGVMQNFASFMAQAAMKNQAKAGAMPKKKRGCRPTNVARRKRRVACP